MNVEPENFEKMEYDWKEAVEIDPKFESYLHKFIVHWSKTEFETMWYGHIGHKSVAKHRIELSSDKF